MIGPKRRKARKTVTLEVPAGGIVIVSVREKSEVRVNAPQGAWIRKKR
jgi:hypothetical protein